MQNGGDAVIDLVREFYSNAEIVNGALSTYVRGIHIDVDENYIQEMRREVPRVLNPTYPPKKNVAMNIVGKEFTGVADFSWTRKRFFRKGELTDKYKMLKLIALANFAPIGRKNEILLEMVRLLYALGKGHSIDLLLSSQMK